MMRYQRLSSPDVLPLSNGRKPSLRTTCKEDDDAEEAGRIGNYSTLEAKSLKLRPSSGPANPSPAGDNHFPQLSFALDSPPASSDSRPPTFSVSASTEPAKTQIHPQIEVNHSGGGGDVLLRWGQRKRSRAPRTESRATTAVPVEGDESPAHSRSAIRVQRRSSAAADAAAMPPPSSAYSRGGSQLRSCTPLRDSSGSLSNKAADGRSGGGMTRSEKRSPQRSSEKPQKAFSNVAAANSSAINPEPKRLQPESEAAVVLPATERLSLNRFEWPRIYVSLSRKEKEDDFLAMKGTKLPQRPKKRAKNIDRTLQYCFPGMWLSDLTRGRYEVREKKCVKKKRRGLKGMESSDSE